MDILQKMKVDHKLVSVARDAVISDAKACKAVCTKNPSDDKIKDLFKSKLWIPIISRNGYTIYRNSFTGSQVKVFEKISKSIRKHIVRSLIKHLRFIKRSRVMALRKVKVIYLDPKRKDVKKAAQDIERLGQKVVKTFQGVLPMIQFLRNIGYRHGKDGQQSYAENKKGFSAFDIEKLFICEPWEKVKIKSGHYKYEDGIFGQVTMGGSTHVDELKEGALIDSATDIQEWIDYINAKLFRLPYPGFVKDSREMQMSVLDLNMKTEHGKTVKERFQDMTKCYQMIPSLAVLRVAALRFQALPVSP